jgi:hypothetical protein
MAVPSIVTVNPTQVSTLGNSLIEILGFDFREPDPPTPDIIPVPEPGPTVQVLFGTTEALRVDVATGGRLIVLLPPLAEGDYDVTVNNLDNDGVPIGGETNTKTDGLKSLYEDLTVESELTNLVRNLVLEFRKQIHPNVYNTVNTDFDEAPFQLQFIAKLPAVVLSGPELLRDALNDFAGDFDTDDSDSGEPGVEFTTRREPRRVNLGFDIIVISDSTVELLNLQYLLEEFIHQNQIFSWTSLAGPTCELDLDFQTNGDFRADSESNESNLRRLRGAIMLREFQIPGSLVRRGTTVFDGVTVETSSFVGENLINPITGEEMATITLPIGQGGPLRSPGPDGDF